MPSGRRPDEGSGEVRESLQARDVQVAGEGTDVPARAPTARRWLRWLFPVAGLVSLIWFLIRVVPKPSRAAYPCQRVAFPLASSFVLWVTGTFGSILALDRAKRLWRRSRVVLAVACALVALVGMVVALNHMDEQKAAAAAWQPDDPPLSPVGQGKGIFPGRVVWVRDPNATSWNGTTGHWWDETSSDQGLVNEMVSKAVRWLTGEQTGADAWDALFRHHNQTRHGQDVGYQAGEKIAIKINEVNAYSRAANHNKAMANPHMVYAVVEQLIDVAGVPPEDITVYDASRYVANCVYNKVAPLGVNVAEYYRDSDGSAGRIKVVADFDAPIHFGNDPVTDPLSLGKDDPYIYNGPYFPPTCLTGAKYFINLANLKAHDLTGVTLCAKNLFGSVYNTDDEHFRDGWGPGDDGLHRFVRTLMGSSAWPDLPPRPYGTYNALVDLIGHEQFAGKALLYVLDGLYVSNNHSSVPNKWESMGNDWTSSVWVSQDPVAIDSVGLDFLRNEPTCEYAIHGDVDNYMHEAAQAGDPPSGTVYDPEDDGAPLTSLGVHEHWNNPVDRQYSRNLGTGLGIELIQAEPSPVMGRYVLYNNSAFDGYDPAANAADDDSIAPDKIALLPGGTASFANYTSYARGINAVCIDIMSLPGTPTPADFQFRVGNDSNPAGWSTLGVAPVVSVRTGAGVAASDRVTLTWPAGTIRGQWLQVTVLANATTGLSDPDVFYFGNAIGETGNSTTDAEVTPSDVAVVRADPHTLAGNPADIENRCDFNRDRKVGPTEEILIRNNSTNSTNALRLITVP